MKRVPTRNTHALAPWDECQPATPRPSPRGTSAKEYPSLRPVSDSHLTHFQTLTGPNDQEHHPLAMGRADAGEAAGGGDGDGDGQRTVLSDVSLTIRQGDLVVVCGAVGRCVALLGEMCVWGGSLVVVVVA